jgi:hypothetical protein
MIWKAGGKYSNDEGRIKPPPPEIHAGGTVLYLPEICSAVLLFEVCLFSILEKVSDCNA